MAIKRFFLKWLFEIIAVICICGAGALAMWLNYYWDTTLGYSNTLMWILFAIDCIFIIGGISWVSYRVIKYKGDKYAND